MERPLLFSLGLLALVGIAACSGASGADDRVELVFSGGHDTDARDNGRPVALVAAGLGVSPQVFRDAFSRVQPVRDGEPSPEHARQNKEVLLSALARYGVRNEDLDRVSDYYRYRRERGEMWTNTPAKGYATISKGMVKSIVLTSGGSGYSSTPTVTIPGHAGSIAVTIGMNKDLSRNGAVTSITLR